MEAPWEAHTNGCTRSRKKVVQAFRISLQTHTWLARMKARRDSAQAKTGVALTKTLHGPVDPSARNALGSTRIPTQPSVIMAVFTEKLPCRKKSTTAAQSLAKSTPCPSSNTLVASQRASVRFLTMSFPSQV